MMLAYKKYSEFEVQETIPQGFNFTLNLLNDNIPFTLCLH
jgi:hypothetical protein